MTPETVSTTTLYRAAPGLRWAVETRGLTLFREEDGVFGCIGYPYAAIWDLLHRGYGRAATARLTSFVANVPSQVALELTDRAIIDWIELGILVREEGDG